MPAVTLVVCLHRQRDLLVRLLRESNDCYDELVVVHDGPDVENIRPLVAEHGGHFFEQPQAFQQEPHWPFAWAQAKHDWILRLDADEFPGAELKKWLAQFRSAPEPAAEISGYTCLWPLWNGERTISRKWPAGRIFLFHKQRVRFFGMNEQSPVADGRYEPTDLVLNHQPSRKSYGFANVLVRPQAYRWRLILAQSLLGRPTDFACWRWTDERWPLGWEQIRQRPLRTAARRLTMMTLREFRDQWKSERKIYFEAALNNSFHHALICLKYWQLRRQKKKSSHA